MVCYGLMCHNACECQQQVAKIISGLFFWSPKCNLDSGFQHGSLPLLSSSSSLMHLQYIWMKRWGEVSQDLKDFQTLLATRVGKDLLPDLPRKRCVKSFKSSSNLSPNAGKGKASIATCSEFKPNSFNKKQIWSCECWCCVKQSCDSRTTLKHH